MPAAAPPPTKTPANGQSPVLRVALPLPLPGLFDYAGATAGPEAIGCRVRVPFGSRELIGVVAEVGAPAADMPELRSVLAALDASPLLHGELLASLRWLARYTHAPLGEVFATALPAALRRGEPLPDTHAWGWRLTEAGATALDGLRKASRPRLLAERLRAGAVPEDMLDDGLVGWRTAARALCSRGLVERVAVAGPAQPVPVDQAPRPNTEQQEAIDALAALDGRFAPLL